MTPLPENRIEHDLGCEPHIGVKWVLNNIIVKVSVKNVEETGVIMYRQCIVPRNIILLCDITIYFFANFSMSAF